MSSNSRIPHVSNDQAVESRTFAKHSLRRLQVDSVRAFEGHVPRRTARRIVRELDLPEGCLHVCPRRR